MTQKRLFTATVLILFACLLVATAPLRGEDIFKIHGPDQTGKKQAASAPSDVRDLRWLSSVDQVKKAENIAAAPIQVSRNVQLLKSRDAIAGCPTQIDFHFFQGELVKIECNLDGTGLSDAYRTINEAMRNKYGNGMSLLEKSEAKNPQLSIEAKYALANMMLLVDQQFYSNPRTEVSVGRRAGSDQVRVSYTPNFAIGRVKEEKRAAELEKLEKESEQESQRAIREKL
jgi:hypothetical protein